MKLFKARIKYNCVYNVTIYAESEERAVELIIENERCKEEDIIEIVEVLPCT